MVSCHVIKIQEIDFKTFGTELRRVVGLHQILVGTVIRPHKVNFLFLVRERVNFL